VRTLLLLIQVMYLSFYLGALANLNEIHDIFTEASLPIPAALMFLLVTTAAILIPVRLFILVAVAFDFHDLQSKFSVLFPVLLIFDLLWAISPFLLIHHISSGLALGLSAPLVYLPFAQALPRSYVLTGAVRPSRLVAAICYSQPPPSARYSCTTDSTSSCRNCASASSP
jgi:cholera toxin transcriptional activator